MYSLLLPADELQADLWDLMSEVQNTVADVMLSTGRYIGQLDDRLLLDPIQ